MSVGVIGGADGPAAIFVSCNFSPWTVGAVIAVTAVLVVGCVLFIRRQKRKKK